MVIGKPVFRKCLVFRHFIVTDKFHNQKGHLKIIQVLLAIILRGEKRFLPRLTIAVYEPRGPIRSNCYETNHRQK